MPRAAASFFTGDAASAKPRPAGRPGCVITPTTRWRDPSSVSRHRAANSGVPAKRTFTDAAPVQGLRERQPLRQSSNSESAGSQPASGRFAELFLKFRLDALLLEARQIVDEDFALEVIHFMLDADREELFCDEGEGFSVQAECAHRHALCALNRLVDSWNGQAALLAILDSLAADDLRIDQNQELVSALGGVDDDHPLVHVDLRCCESHPRRCVHRFGHVPYQGANRLVNFQYWRGPLIEPRIGV